MRKKTAVLVVTFLSAAVIVLGVFARSSASRAKALEYYARANTQHAFDELVTSMTELSTTLQKSVYISDPALEAVLCTQVFGRALTAQMALGVLPYASGELEQTASFVAKVGDYACALSRTVGANGGYLPQELETLTALSETAGVLSQNLTDMQAQILAGTLTMAEAVQEQQEAGGGDENGAPTAGSSFQSIESEFPELPVLLYDGPFSDGLATGQARALAAMQDVEESWAKGAAADFLNVDDRAVQSAGAIGGDLPGWRFTAGETSVSVTRRGGVILSALSGRTPGEARLSVEEGLAAAEAMLERWGVYNMRRSYHMVQGNVLTVNFHYAQKGVLCYPDLIKIGVALDDGSLMSYDARGYIDCHTRRELPKPQITQEEAVAQAEKTMTPEQCELAVIPTPGGEELLCYELLCRASDDTRLLLYVNAVTGAQEKILLLLEDENGSLTL